MTEDEAKTKWCPFVRVASLHESKNPREWIGVAGANRAVSSGIVDKKGVGDDGLPDAARCIGSACMAWRYERRRFETNDEGRVREALGGAGYCGLAGAPNPLMD